MGNTCCYCSNVITFPQVEDVNHHNAAISFIEMRLDAIRSNKREEGTSGVETVTDSDGVDSFVKYGSHFLSDVARRVKRHTLDDVARRGIKRDTLGDVARCVKRHTCKIVKPNSDIKKAVTDILRGAKPVRWVGVGLGVVAYVLDQVQMDKNSSSINEFVELLCFMSDVAKHIRAKYIKQQTNYLDQDKLNELVVFIVKGSLVCMSRMQSTNSIRLVDEEEIKNLQSQLIRDHPELALYTDEDDKQNSVDLPEEDILSSLEETMSYIEKRLIKRTATDKAEENTRQVTSSIKYGSYLLMNVLKRCKINAIEIMSGETRTVVIDVLKEASKIKYVGAGLSVVAYVLQKVDDASTNKEECFEFLKHMYHLAKHIKGLDGHIPNEKLHDVAEFIFKGSFFCLSRIESSNLSRFLSSKVDVQEIKSLQSELGETYQDLTLEALISALHQMPKLLPLSQGQNNLDAVGLDQPVVEVKERLRMDDKQDLSTRAVVIYGIGGMGKRTLAKAVFSSLELGAYKYCHLIIKQECSKDDILKLQKQILNDLFGQNLELRSSAEGHQQISKVFRRAARQPIFLFIENALKGDDLAKILPEDLSCMPKRSRILVTTRKLDETNMLDRPDIITRLPYAINCLPSSEAKRLLCKKALDSPDGTFSGSSDIDGLVKVCGGIPLVLNLVGTRLRQHCKDPSALNSTVESFKELLEKGESELTKNVVDVVYDSLPGDQHKYAFLDIAAFFSSWERQIVSYIVGEDELVTLEGAALVKISDGRVELHDVVRQRGRKLSASDRITDRQSLADIIKDKERLEKVKGIYLPQELELRAEHLDKMHKCLRVLILSEGTKVAGICTQKFQNLRYLNVHERDCSPMEISQDITPRLAIFEGPIRIADGFCDFPHSLRKLRVKVSEWDESFVNLPCLEELELSQTYLMDIFSQLKFSQSRVELTRLLQRFGKLSRLPQSFGKLTSLRRLQLSLFSELTSLPDTFGELSNLKELTITDCSQLCSLPDSFGQLRSLQCLTILDCQSLERLGDNFGQLRNLKELIIIDCPKLSNLSDDFGMTKSLLNLIINHCQSLERLSDNFGQLSNLKELTITNCPKLFNLCDDFGQMKSLEYLKLGDCQSLEKMSATFGELANLKYLRITGCPKLSNLSDDFGHLKSLLNLSIEHCQSLEKLSDTFGQLSNLKELYLRKCPSLFRLGDDFGSLASVTKINVVECPVLEGKAVDQMIELKSLVTLNISQSGLLMRRWEKIKEGQPQLVVTGWGRDIMSNSDAVRMDEARDKVIKLLDPTDQSPRCVVLHGDANIGKTNLATAVISSLNLNFYNLCRIKIQKDSKQNVISQLRNQLVSWILWRRKSMIYLFIENALKGSSLAELLRMCLPCLPKKSRILITTRNLAETDVIEDGLGGIKRYSYSVDGLSEEDSKKFLCWKAFSSANEVFGKSSKLRKFGTDVRACQGTIEVFKDTLAKGEGCLSGKVINLLNTLKENPYKDEFLDIAEFFCNWREKTVGYIVGEEALKALEEAALVEKTREGRVIVQDYVQAQRRKLSEEYRITDPKSFLSALQDTQRLEKLKGIQLSNLQLQAEHLDKMHKCLRVLHLGRETEVSGACTRVFESLKCLQLENGDCSPMQLNKLPKLAIFKGRIRNDDSFSNLPGSLRSLKVNNLKSPALDESFGKLSCLEELELSQDEQYMGRLPQSFGHLKSLRFLKLSHFRELTHLPDNFGQLSNLEELNISDCTNLASLSANFGELSKLKRLKIINCENIPSLPESFANLNNLKELLIVNCTNLSSLCDNFGQLKSLEILGICGCRTLKRLSDDFGSLTSVAAIETSRCPSLEGKAVDQMVELKSLKILNIRESHQLIKCWEEIKVGHPLLVCTETKRDIMFRHSIPRALFHKDSRFMEIDGEVRDWSSTLPAGDEKIAFLVSCSNLCSWSNKKVCEMAKKKIAALSREGFQIVYVGLMDQSEESIRETLRHLSKGIRGNAPLSLCAWIPPSPGYKWKEVFGFSACMMLASKPSWTSDSSAWRVQTFIAKAHISVSEQDNPQVQYLEQIFPKNRDSQVEDFRITDSSVRAGKQLFGSSACWMFIKGFFKAFRNFVWGVHGFMARAPISDSKQGDLQQKDIGQISADEKGAMTDLGEGFSALYSHLHGSFISSTL